MALAIEYVFRISKISSTLTVSVNRWFRECVVLIQSYSVVETQNRVLRENPSLVSYFYKSQLYGPIEHLHNEKGR